MDRQGEGLFFLVLDHLLFRRPLGTAAQHLVRVPPTAVLRALGGRCSLLLKAEPVGARIAYRRGGM